MASESAFERQHPLAWIFDAWSTVRAAVIPAVAFLVFSQGFALGWLAALLVLPAVAVGVAKHLALGYSLRDGEIVVRDGILNRKERRIRFSRIQNLEEVQGLLHRLVGAVAIKLETAGGSTPEAVLHLSPVAAARLRDAILGASDEDAGERERRAAEPALLEVPTADLVRLGLIKNRGFLVVAAVVGALSQLDVAGDAWWKRAEHWVPGLLERGVEGFEVSWAAILLASVGVLAGAYLLLSALSISFAIVRFFGFTLRREEDDLRARFGLLTRVQKAIPRRRVQRLIVEESLLHRLLGRISIRLDTAGGVGGSLAGASSLGDIQDAEESGRQWLAPVTVRQRLRELVAVALPRLSLEPLERSSELTPDASSGEAREGWRPIASAATKRLFNKSVLALLIVAYGLSWLTLWALLLPLLTPLLWWLCRNYVRHRRYWLTRDALWFRAGWLGRKLTVIPFEKIQSVTFRASPFDRRYRMASVAVDTARSGGFYAASIPYLDAEEARRVVERLALEAGRRDFVWS